MSDKQITVPSVVASSLLDMIEERLHAIGKTYWANGQSYQDDLEITALRSMARQMGIDFEVKSADAGFEIIRHDVSHV